MSTSSSSSSGIGFGGLLTIVFVTLKLMDIISWSWWWVTAPLWIPAAVIIVFILIPCIIAFILFLIAKAAR